jgi:hypothetical protein
MIVRLRPYLKPTFYIVIIAGSTYLYWRFVFIGYFEFYSSFLTWTVSILSGLLTGLLVWIWTQVVPNDEMFTDRVHPRKDVLLARGLFISVYLILMLIISGICASVDRKIENWAVNRAVGDEVSLVCNMVARKQAESMVGQLGVLASNRTGLLDDMEYEKARVIDEIDTLLCIEVRSQTLESCRYRGGATITRSRGIWEIQVVDWKTRQVRASSVIHGSEPRCPPTSANSGHRSSRPSSSVINQWLNSIEKGAIQ